jgi:hypothetical protein
MGRGLIPGTIWKISYIIFLSHILHWPFPSIDFYIAKKIYEQTNCEIKSLIISYYHIFCCNMFIFACPIIAKSQCWLFTLRANTGKISIFALKYPYLPSYIRIFPHIQLPVPATQSRANMGRGMITRPIWKCPCIKLRDYYMTFSISALVLARDSHIEIPIQHGVYIWANYSVSSTLDPYQPSSFAVGLDMGVSG